MSDRAEQLVKRFQHANENRANWLSRWQSVGDYINPIRGDITAERSYGMPRHTLIFDDTAQMASDILVAGLFSYMTSPYMPWFRLTPREIELLKDDDAALWLQDCENRMYLAYAKCEFYNAIATMYKDLIDINHGLVFIDENMKEKKLSFRNLSPKDCVIFENNFQKVDSFARKIKFSARQAVQEWGDKVNKDITQAIADGKPDKLFDFLHFVQPRNDYNKWKKDSANLPWASVYIDMKEKEIMEEGGYHEFPLVAPRWSTYTDDVYGSCPGISALNNVKTLNKAMELLIRQAEAQVNPPLQVTPGFKDRIKTMPGGINVKARKDDDASPIVTVGKIEITDKLIADLREQVRDRYFVSTFLMLSQLEQRMTAYEVSQRENEKMMMLGPAIGRITDECLGPLIDRTFNIMLRGGYFLPIPESLMDVELDVEYLSPLARAQKAVQAGSIDRLVAFMAPLTQLYPEIADNLNPDEAIRFYGDTFGVPKSVMRGTKAIQSMRDERAKMQQQEVMRNQMLQATEGIKNIAESDRAATGDKSMLSQIMGM